MVLVKILAVLIGLGLVLAVAGEVLAPPLVEREIEARVEDRLQVGEVDADLGSFPVVARVLASSEVRTVVVTLDRLAEQPSPVVIDRVRVELTGVHLERSALFDGEARLEDVERGNLVAEITEEDIEVAVPGGADVELSPGRVTATVAGVTVDAAAVVEGGQLRLDLGPVPAITVPLPVELFPCTLDVAVEQDRVRLSCTLDEVPDWMVAEANSQL